MQFIFIANKEVAFLSPKSFTIQSSQLLCKLGFRKKFLEYVHKECLYAKIAKFALQICSRAFWTFQKEIHRWRSLKIYSRWDSIFWMCVKEIRRIKEPFFQLIHILLHVLSTLFQMYHKILIRFILHKNSQIYIKSIYMKKIYIKS